MKNHEDNELHIEKMDADIAQAYNEANDVPDLWDRISAGFDAELKNARADDLAPENLTDKVTGGKHSKKRLYYKRYIGFAAAALILCVIVIPVINNGLLKKDRTAMDMADDNLFDESSDDAEWANETASAFDGDVNGAAVSDSDDIESEDGSYDGEAADESQIGNTYNSVTSDAHSADSVVQESAGAEDYDESCEDNVNDEASYTVEVSGSIYRDGDKYILTVSAVLSQADSGCIIGESDSLQLINAEDNLSLNDGEIVTYDTIRLKAVAPMDETYAGAPKYRAEIVEFK
jgi:hypothetical protein